MSITTLQLCSVHVLQTITLPRPHKTLGTAVGSIQGTSRTTRTAQFTWHCCQVARVKSRSAVKHASQENRSISSPRKTAVDTKIVSRLLCGARFFVCFAVRLPNTKGISFVMTLVVELYRISRSIPAHQCGLSPNN